MAKRIKLTENYPVIPLRNTIVVPSTITPLLVGRPASIMAAEKALLKDKKIVCVTQKNNAEYEEDPKAKELYRYGTVCTILQVLKLPDGTMRLLIEGDYRVKITRFLKVKLHMEAMYQRTDKVQNQSMVEFEALQRSLKKAFSHYVKLNKSIPEESLFPLHDSSKPDEFFYFALANIQVDIRKKQRLFEIDNLFESMNKMFILTNKEIQILRLENKIDGSVKNRLNKMQREYYLTEQLKAINKELGITKEEKAEYLEFKEKFDKLNLNPEARKKADEELAKLGRMNHFSPEYSVIHTYLNWIHDLPWNDPEMEKFSLTDAQKILNDDHYGLVKVKERILEYLAIVKLADKVKGHILCFVGPPGVGKTSLGKSIARAMKRKFVRLSLGGVRDEAEIRGHRRTYVGALPGVIVQSMKKAGTRNPLIMMDEIDKMSMDFRGDPASALLEVLDPEQNNSFRDHYLDFSYDLSQVIFITTANTLSTVPRPLLDRMEVIELPGYTAFEKLNIAVDHLVPKVIKEHEIEDQISIKYNKRAIEKIISLYTREAGVRELERQIAKILRKVAKEYVEGNKTKKVIINYKDLEKYLGIPMHLYSEVNRKNAVGVVTGLAWTAYGGETLQIEVVKMKGDGKLKLTGQLGEVMQESAKAAYSYARINAEKFGIDEDFYKKYDIHLHIPEGAIPKDGPSAGITIVTAIISILSGRKVRSDLAMTGELTLTGNILPIGGLAEKLIAAKRVKIKTVLIPKKNEPSLKEIQDEIKKDLEIIFVNKLDDVLEVALLK